MTSIQKPVHLSLKPEDHRRLAILCGQLNENLHCIEKNLAVQINNHGFQFSIVGSVKNTEQTCQILKQLYEQTQKCNNLSIEQVQLTIKSHRNRMDKKIEAISHPDLTIATQLAQIKPRTNNQLQYIESIKKYEINFGVGPSGTGKTFLAVAMAAQALENNEVKRVILVRPAVEAGEKLGFLPGDLSDKIDPYLRPLYDALYHMLGASKVNKMIEKNIIEVAPLAYMRGRTLNDAFIILDESQNTTPEQMKMFLTRIGFGSQAIITGDITQIDLPKHADSGLRHAIEVLSKIPSIHFTFFVADDVVRHPLVQKIIYAYEQYEEKLSNKS